MTTSAETPNAADDVDTDRLRADLVKIVACTDRSDISRAASRITELCDDLDKKVGR
jgi:hypothetical protein